MFSLRFVIIFVAVAAGPANAQKYVPYQSGGESGDFPNHDKSESQNSGTSPEAIAQPRMSPQGTMMFLLIPSVVLMLSAFSAMAFKIPETIEQALQHFAGGVVLSATATARGPRWIMPYWLASATTFCVRKVLLVPEPLPGGKHFFFKKRFQCQ